ncbi:MAG TPA: hypothetical protein VL049_14365 [Candidatus Dormibacteraeota bacterium]|nr:hypothetical protein [Candidatus Dormibacteraeota bacterium]
MSPTATKSPTITPTFATIGPLINAMGVARADGQVTQPIDTAGDGTPIFQRAVGFGFFLYIEARPGLGNRPVGQVTYNSDLGDPNALPNLQVVVSRALGNGSTDVCDDGPDPPIGGVPATNPPMFGGSQTSANAINDLSCRFNARTTSGDACTDNSQQDPSFVVATTRVQFCPAVGVGSEIAFPVGDTRVTARITDVIGQPGPPASIIIRVLP